MAQNATTRPVLPVVDLQDFEVEDLAAAALGLPEDTDSVTIENALSDRTGVDLPTFMGVAELLLPLTLPGQSPLTGTVYQGFALGDAWVVKRPFAGAPTPAPAAAELQPADHKTESLWIKAVLEAAQRLASAWALVGSRFDTGQAAADAEAVRTELHSLLCFSPAARLLDRLLNPSDLGHAVSAEVRDAARDVFAMQRVETAPAAVVEVQEAEAVAAIPFEQVLHAGRYTRPDGIELLLQDLERTVVDMACMRDQARRALASGVLQTPGRAVAPELLAAVREASATGASVAEYRGQVVFLNRGNSEEQHAEHEAYACPACTGSGHRDDITPAARDVLAERSRQVTAEGWTPEHDDEHANGEMATAAACYAMMGRYHYPTPGMPPDVWPWAASWWKPAGFRRNLVKATALLLAEIERLDRATRADSKGGA